MLTSTEHLGAKFLEPTALLDFHHQRITDLISRRGWDRLEQFDRIGVAYDFVQNEILFGYNQSDYIRASEVLSRGFGQCNTKATLFMAFLRALNIPCRLHGFTVDKSLQRGLVPEPVYWMAPKNILHSWVEVRFQGRWVKLEGFILDRDYLAGLQKAFAASSPSLCAYAVGTDCLHAPRLDWQGTDTYIQKKGINADLGTFRSPDKFFLAHGQHLGWLKDRLYRHVIRHWMNRRVAKIRAGQLPAFRPKKAKPLIARSTKRARINKDGLQIL